MGQVKAVMLTKKIKPLKHRQTPKLLTAIEKGAEIRERLTYAPAVHRPRTAGDPCPWVVYDEGLEQEFHLSGRDCMAVWPDGTWTAASGERIEKRFR